MRVSEGGRPKPNASVVASGNALNTLVSPKPKAKLPTRAQPGTADIAGNREKAFAKENQRKRQANLTAPDPDAVRILENPGDDEMLFAARLRALVRRPGDKGTRSAFTFASMGGVDLSQYLPKRDVDRVQAEIDSWHRAGNDLSLVPRVKAFEDVERDQIIKTLNAVGRKATHDMSDAELQRLLQQPDRGPILGDAVSRFLPNLGETMYQLPLGSWAAGAAVGGAARGVAEAGLGRVGVGNGAEGDEFDDAKLVAGSTYDWYKNFAENPGETFRNEPAGVLFNVVAPAKGITGGVAGAAARTGALGKAAKGFATQVRADIPVRSRQSGAFSQERANLEAQANVFDDLAAQAASKQEAKGFTQRAADLRNAALDATADVVHADRRPSLSPELWNRAGQRLNDALIARNVGAGRAIRKDARKGDDQARAEGYQQRDAILRDLNDVSGRRAAGLRGAPTTKDEQRAALAIGQDIKPSEKAAYYQQQLLAAEAPMANAGLKRSKRELKAQAKLWERIAKNTQDGTSEGTLRAVEAARGAAGARESILTDLNVLDPTVAADRIQRPGEHVRNELGIQRPPVTEPFFVKHSDKGTRFGGFLQGRSQRPLVAIEKETKYRNELKLLASGRDNPEWNAFASHVAAAPTKAARLFALRDLMERNGRAAEPGSLINPETHVLVRADPGMSGGRPVLPDGVRPVLAKALDEDGRNPELVRDLNLEVVPEGGRVPAQGEFVVLPRTAWNEVVKAKRGDVVMNAPVLRQIEQATQAWRFITLGLRPAYIAPNVAGVFQASILGGTGPFSIARAAMPKYKNVSPEKFKHQNFAQNATRVTHSGSQGNGRLVGGVSEIFQRPLTGPESGGILSGAARAPFQIPYRAAVATGHKVIDSVGKMDGFMRRAQWLHEAIPDARKAVGGNRFHADAADLMAELQRGAKAYDKGTAKQGDWAIPAAEKVVRMLGDFSKSPNRVAQTAIPFYPFFKFVIKQTLVDLPIHHPVRAALVFQIGQLGVEQQKAMGMEGFDVKGGIPTNVREDDDGNILSDIVRTPPWNYPSAMGDLFPSTPSGGGTDWWRAGSGALNPVGRAGFAAGRGEDLETGAVLRDENGDAVSEHDRPVLDLIKAFGNEGMYALPITSLVAPRRRNSETRLDQPERTFNQRLFGYLSGLNVVTKNLTLQQRQAIANLRAPKNAPPELEQLISELKRRAGVDISDPVMREMPPMPLLPKKMPKLPRLPDGS